MTFVWHAIDPPEEALLAALDEAVDRALVAAAEAHGISPVPKERPRPQALPARAAALAEGAHCLWSWREDWPYASWLAGVAWWTDAIGRRHWAAETGEVNDSPYTPLHRSPELAETHPHPLALIYPEQQGGWRERGGRREWLVRCGCGECGTLAELAWMGECCGPCFDRHTEEGTPPREEPFLPRIAPGSPLAFTSDGKLVAYHAIFAHLAAWSPPWSEDHLTWHTPTEARAIGSLGKTGWLRSITSACGVVALNGAPSGVVLFDAGDGHPLGALPRHTGLADASEADLAGDAGQWLVRLTVSYIGERRNLVVTDRHTGGLLFCRGTRHERLCVTPDGSALLLAGDVRWPTVEIRQAPAGSLLRVLRLPGCSHVEAVAAGPGGEVFGFGPVRDADATRLARWEAPANTLRPGVFRRLAMSAGLAGIEPSQVREVARPLHRLLAVSADGRHLAAGCDRGGAAIFDAGSLEELAFIRSDEHVVALAFSPDGDTLAVAGRRISLWPPRHLVEG